MQFGMSRLGRVNYKESGRNPFLSTSDEISTASHSGQTAHEIDQEVKQIIEDGLSKVRHILSTRRETLVALSQRLVECEVMDADELREIVDQTSVSPQIVPGTESDDFMKSPHTEGGDESTDSIPRTEDGSTQAGG